jgi:hypothetical protein
MTSMVKSKLLKHNLINGLKENRNMKICLPTGPKLTTNGDPYAKQRMFINEGIFGSPLMGFAASLMQLENLLLKTGATPAEIKKAADAAKAQRKAFMEEENIISDRNIV